MPTLLVTKKMSAELARRVEASVEGRTREPGSRLAPRARAMVRAVALTSLVVLVVLVTSTLLRESRALDARRTKLLQRQHELRADLGPDDLDAPRRMAAFLPEFAGARRADDVDGELAVPDAWAKLVAAPGVYLRSSLAGVSGRVEDSAESSLLDAFVLCLRSPPRARTETELRSKARAAAGGRASALEGMARLYDLLVGLPLLGADFEGRVRRADTLSALAKLERELDRAPLPRAKLGARARYFWVVVDEPSFEKVPAELDGERPHDVRVGLVDLVRGKVLLRLARKVDPSFVSAPARAEHASGIDSCALAWDVRAAVEASAKVSAGP